MKPLQCKLTEDKVEHQTNKTLQQTIVVIDFVFSTCWQRQWVGFGCVSYKSCMGQKFKGGILVSRSSISNPNPNPNTRSPHLDEHGIKVSSMFCFMVQIERLYRTHICIQRIIYCPYSVKCSIAFFTENLQTLDLLDNPHFDLHFLCLSVHQLNDRFTFYYACLSTSLQTFNVRCSSSSSALRRKPSPFSA